MTFGEKIQKLRKESGLSQEELSYQLGVSRQAISKWEHDSGYHLSMDRRGLCIPGQHHGPVFEEDHFLDTGGKRWRQSGYWRPWKKRKRNGARPSRW